MDSEETEGMPQHASEVFHQDCDETCPAPRTGTNIFTGQALELGCPVHDADLLADAVAGLMIHVARMAGTTVALAGLPQEEDLDQILDHINAVSDRIVAEAPEEHDEFAHSLGVDLIDATASFIVELAALEFRHNAETLMRGLGSAPRFIEGDVASP